MEKECRRGLLCSRTIWNTFFSAAERRMRLYIPETREKLVPGQRRNKDKIER